MSQPTDASSSSEPIGEKPVGSIANLPKNFRSDVISGFLVFLIALPLCLGISIASGFPAINGVFTAIIGGMVCVFFSNSELTIKGPAAGMIAIVMGAVTDFAKTANVTADAGNPEIYMQYLPTVAGIAVVAGGIQIVAGLMKAGSLADFFPTSVIHGLLASIGLIIVGKQLYPLLGLKPNSAERAYEAYLELPEHLPHFAWQVAVIGVVALVFLFVYPTLKKSISIFKGLPAQLIILAVAIPAAIYLLGDFSDGSGTFSRKYDLSHGENPTQQVKTLLVKVPASLEVLKSSIIFPSFQHIGTAKFWTWVLMFMLVGSIESLLSAKAVDTLDPWKRRSDLNRDLTAVGLANLLVGLIGGLPMISEIVRSSANKDYGARTRGANFFHGLFLLLSIVLLPFLLNKIPLAALAAMLIYAGCRLANYKEFIHMWEVGKEQFIIFVATIIGVLATDLLIGVAVGIVTKLVIHLINGLPITSIFSPAAQFVEQIDEDDVIIRVSNAVVFSNWLPLRSKIVRAGIENKSNVTLDFSTAKLVDHTVMDKLHELQKEFEASYLKLSWTGLEQLNPLSAHPLAARKK
ncbi:MAG: SulP family inorganic anion transporter [Pirellulales bacterium]